ncbi:MAG: helix-turn-helix transcriptional regulator [Deltaproteobacteria bacterium]|nr:helix-turn-helix transcriptional regulator [Deltaproteobacteria bacterium]
MLGYPGARDCLRRRRLGAGLSQSRLAELTGFSRDVVKHLEAGRDAGSLDFWERAEEILLAPRELLWTRNPGGDGKDPRVRRRPRAEVEAGRFRVEDPAEREALAEAALAALGCGRRGRS